jgi:hypothetical protein
VNFGICGLGIGIYASQAGSGWGIQDFMPAGIEVIGSGNSGLGTYGQRASGISVFETNASNISDISRKQISQMLPPLSG